MAIDALDSDRVLGAVSMVEKRGVVKQAETEARRLADLLGGWSDLEYGAASLRVDRWMETFISGFEAIEDEHGAPHYVAVESFVDQRSRAREEQQRLVKNRWMTPLLIGELAVYLADRGYTVANGRLIYQNAGTVIKQWATEIGMLENRRARGKSAEDLLVVGDHQVSNDHLRKAFVHARALSVRVRRHGSSVATVNAP